MCEYLIRISHIAQIKPERLFFIGTSPAQAIINIYTFDKNYMYLMSIKMRKFAAYIIHQQHYI